MKKFQKKLKLHRETLHHLGTAEIRQAGGGNRDNGGGPTVIGETCPSVYAYSCTTICDTVGGFQNNTNP